MQAFLAPWAAAGLWALISFLQVLPACIKQTMLLCMQVQDWSVEPMALVMTLGCPTCRRASIWRRRACWKLPCWAFPTPAGCQTLV